MIWQRTYLQGLVAAAMLLGLAVFGTLFAVAARADTFPGNNDTRVAQSAALSFCFYSNFTTSVSTGYYAMSNLDSQTVMYDIEVGTCANYVDVWWSELGGSGIYGFRYCSIPVDSSTCDSSDIKIDFGEIDGDGSWDWEMRRKVATHETGHAVGLGHDSDTNTMT